MQIGVMFADVTGSTSLYEELGDATASRIISKVVDILTRVTEAYGGNVIKTIGDGIMCRFTSPSDTVRAAIRCQEQVSAGILGEEVEISIKIGLHFGSAILNEEGDAFGDAINISARMGDIATASQIITTRETVALLDEDLQAISRKFDTTSVKGKEEEMVVHQIVWEVSDEVTRIEIPERVVEQQIKYLALDFRDRQLRLSSDIHQAFLIGRGPQCDLHCKTALASRVHATLEFRRGKFLLTDQSSNGTYVTTSDGENIFLRRQEMILWGSGSIGFGEEVANENPQYVLKYICE